VDLPPAYEDDDSLLVAKLHRVVPALLHDDRPAGVLLARLADWATHKADLGVGSAVLDRLIAASAVRVSARARTHSRVCVRAAAAAVAVAAVAVAAVATRAQLRRGVHASGVQDMLLCAGARLSPSRTRWRA
jgi:hypothetical protein